MNDGPITEQGDPRDRITNQLPLPPSRPVTGPIDTIREALTRDREHIKALTHGMSPDRQAYYLQASDADLAALTQVEHQLAALEDGRMDLARLSEEQLARAVAAETALAASDAALDKATVFLAESEVRREAAERRAEVVERALRGLLDFSEFAVDASYLDEDPQVAAARAALARQEQT